MVRFLLILGISFLGLFSHSPATAFQSESQYLSKLFEPRPTNLNYKFFVNHRSSSSVDKWLLDLDQKLFDYFAASNCSANFSIVFNFDGSIRYLNLEEPYIDLFECKNFIARLANFEAPELPEDLTKDLWVFDLEARSLYISRTLLRTELHVNSSSDSSKSLPDLSLDQIKLKLIDPIDISYPYIGQALKLQNLDSGDLLEARILDLNSRSILLNVSQIGDKVLFDKQLITKIFREDSNPKGFLGTVVASSLNAASQAGFGGSLATYGILPAGLAALGFGAAVLKYRGELLAINQEANLIMEEIK